MNIQNRQKLSEIIKTARGTMSQRALYATPEFLCDRDMLWMQSVTMGYRDYFKRVLKGVYGNLKPG